MGNICDHPWQDLIEEVLVPASPLLRRERVLIRERRVSPVLMVTLLYLILMVWSRTPMLAFVVSAVKGTAHNMLFDVMIRLSG